MAVFLVGVIFGCPCRGHLSPRAFKVLQLNSPEKRWWTGKVRDASVDCVARQKISRVKIRDRKKGSSGKVKGNSNGNYYMATGEQRGKVGQKRAETGTAQKERSKKCKNGCKQTKKCEDIRGASSCCFLFALSPVTSQRLPYRWALARGLFKSIHLQRFWRASKVWKTKDNRPSSRVVTQVCFQLQATPPGPPPDSSPHQRPPPSQGVNVESVFGRFRVDLGW